MDDQELKFQRVKDRRALSVQVYDQLVEVLRKNAVPGAVIPPEVRLAQDLGVSRTVLREALRLLEEDGVIERAADPRRRQLAAPGKRPPAFSAPLEEIVTGAGELKAKVMRHGALSTTNWSRSLLNLPQSETELLSRETLFQRGDIPVVSALEVVPFEALKEARPLDDGVMSGSLLNDLGPKFRSKCVATLWRLSDASTGGRPRSGFADVAPDVPLVSLTTVLSRNGRPVFLAKYLLRLDLVSLNVGAAGAEPGAE
ncbi:GntR family transcriptional regulator [Celeribacter neptunius]|uniref:DNA-binding transcriptional regulator, GntR family n=1 Tax=Celeribacter neptunius TaxID=588602 RepID=A0A1I3VU05_9RHOB|nr:GntR family transcriptional regulator [Celeribacter neptunius]SFJ97621.1 DNA-binding transcriptional regulator, GntR family [Celeribacter neptunius]